jgi:hypothetical protein
VTDVNSHVEVVVIPVRLMITAPLPGCVHPGDIVFNLMAMLAVAVDIAIDSSAIRFETAAAIVLPIPVSASGTSKSKQETTGQHTREEHPVPDFFVLQISLPGLDLERNPRSHPVPFTVTAMQNGPLSAEICSLAKRITDRFTPLHGNG